MKRTDSRYKATFPLPSRLTAVYRTRLMPRIPRSASTGHAYHVLNRGNGGSTVFHKDADYAAFPELLGVAKAQHPIKIFGFCLMSNHFHLVVTPTTAESLSPFMQWRMTSQVRRYHRHYRSHGHVWQGRFKSFPIQQDSHLLTVLRYVLHNPVRARLVEQAGEWPWSSLRYPQLVAPLPASRSAEVRHRLDAPLLDDDLATLRTCVNRQQPFGSPSGSTALQPGSGWSPRCVLVAVHGNPDLKSSLFFLATGSN